MKLQSYPINLFNEAKEQPEKPIKIRVPKGSLFLKTKALFTGFYGYYLIPEGDIDMSDSEEQVFLLPKNTTSIDPTKWELDAVHDFIWEKPDGETMQFVQPIFKQKSKK